MPKIVTIGEATEAYQIRYNLDPVHINGLPEFGFAADLLHDACHIISGRVPEYLQEGQSLQQAMERAQTENKEDFLWTKADVIFPIYRKVVFRQPWEPDRTLQQMRECVDMFTEAGSRFVQTLAGKDITSQFNDLQTIMRRDQKQGSVARLSDEDLSFHYARACSVRESFDRFCVKERIDFKNCKDPAVLTYPLKIFVPVSTLEIAGLG